MRALKERYLVVLDNGENSMYDTIYAEAFQTQEELEAFVKETNPDEIMYITEILDKKDFGLED